MRKTLDHTKPKDMELLADALRAVDAEVFDRAAPALAAKGLIKSYKVAGWAVAILVRRKGVTPEAAWRHLADKMPGLLFGGTREALAREVVNGSCATDPRAAGGFDSKDVASICTMIGISGRTAAQRLAASLKQTT